MLMASILCIFLFVFSFVGWPNSLGGHYNDGGELDAILVAIGISEYCGNIVVFENFITLFHNSF